MGKQTDQSVRALDIVGDPFPEESEALVAVLVRLTRAVEANTSAIRANGVVLRKMHKNIRRHVKEGHGPRRMTA